MESPLRYIPLTKKTRVMDTGDLFSFIYGFGLPIYATGGNVLLLKMGNVHFLASLLSIIKHLELSNVFTQIKN